MKLILACTMYQLMNAINLKTSYLADDDVDLILSKSTDFSAIAESLMESGLFRKIYFFSNYLILDREFKSKSEKERNLITRSPDVLYGDMKQLECAYTDFYTATDDCFAKLLYYYLLKHGHISIHIYEDGLWSYSKNYSNRLKNDGINHSHYRNKEFKKSISEILLYDPDLFMGRRGCLAELNAMPNINDGCAKQICSELFSPLPTWDTKWIFLAEAFIASANFVDDQDALRCISEIIGKDNIMVKMHPRITDDRFSARGYRVLANSLFPFEAFFTNKKSSSFAAVSFYSTACITAKLVFDVDVYVIFLNEMPYIGAKSFNKNPEISKFQAIIRKMHNKFYKNDPHYFYPKNHEELEEMLKYVEGKLNEK